MRRFSALVAALLAVLLALPCAAAPAGPAAPRRLKIGLDGAYPPFSRLAADGTIDGFDVEVARAVCAKLPADCDLVTLGWDDLVPALLARRVDVTVASQPITDEARRRIEFTRPYWGVPPRFVGRLVDPPTATPPAGLAGRRVGVRAGTVHAAWLATAHPEAQRVPFAAEADALEALADGRVDLVFGDTLTLFDRLERLRPLGRTGFVGGEVVDTRAFGAGAGLGFRREDRDLGATLDRALLELDRDGTLDRLVGHWFPFAIR
ncbi:transporter substrate-binding domain-containing protein [Siculibacillus lacustris]|uniref:Transporter substrate-binding domain-containing protein n=1 Tax=Siculibacillus lacustris TaxID=1549641 RepID=A0A4Q9VZ68_9HYPH|nr:transporter substrate-binding domain-containing protein [Siculibacillus lacustris]TBW40929.1 transporter substrate-binding domain-containing protein [Siculibacillus lacustris]